MSLTPLQRLADLLRKIHLLQSADFFWFLRVYWLDHKDNNQFKNEHPDIPIPPPMMLYDIQGNCNLSGFYYGGLSHANEIQELLLLRFLNKI